jgi:membrane peptidoglycan carboxypeptidase
LGVVRALSRNFSAGEVVEGGSTITQQLVKVLHLERSRTIRRKIQEAVLSLWLESRLSKDEILTRYLNSIYMGAGATGMPAAARIYFNKSVSELTLTESTMLAGLIAAPSTLNPLENLQGARERGAVVLHAMGQAGYLDDKEILEAQANSAQLQPQRPELGAGSWFADWAMQQAHEIAGPFRGSIRVTTTLVPELQLLAERTIAELLDDDARAKGATQAALVALAPDGAVLAMVGGVDYKASQFNRAVLAQRQPGSTFKLFVYYAALRAGLLPNYPVIDEPVDLDGWRPENFGGQYYGQVSMAEAFARSLNAATVWLGIEVGLPAVVAAARDLGIDGPLSETPSLFLGASEVSLLDLTGAYASVRAGVAPIEPWGISSFEAEGSRPFRIGPAVAPVRPLGPYHDPLVGLLKLVVDRGTGQEAALDGFAAGKTGTSQNYRDAWFIGFNENLTVGVWIGNDEGKPMDEITGGKLPAQIWSRFMTAAFEPGRNQGVAPHTGSSEVDPTAAAEPLQCNVRACSRSYRSFRASDCTFQPYRGQRKLCER